MKPRRETVFPTTRGLNWSITSSDSFGTDATDFGVLPEDSVLGSSRSKGRVTLTSNIQRQFMLNRAIVTSIGSSRSEI